MNSSAVIAVGGNSLIRAGEKGTIAEQKLNAGCVARSIVRLLAGGLRAVVTHGNGPQVGAALLRSERAAGQAYQQGLDVCVASTQGEIGYLLQQSIGLEAARTGLRLPVTTVLTQVVVAGDDPSFLAPDKPVGPFYSLQQAEERSRLFGWKMVEDASRGYRRAVPSPRPVEIVEEEFIRRVLGMNALVIAVGGGGIPVVREGDVLRGVDAVVDKDRASGLLASRISARLLIFSTDADCLYLNFRKQGQIALERIKAAELTAFHNEGHFPAGSMGPKVEAALDFLQAGGSEAIITSNERLGDALEGGAGTHIVPD